MDAIVMDPHAPHFLARGETLDPRPRPDQVLVRVVAFSLNRGEVRDLGQSQAGVVPGWDAAGTVLRDADTGEGPSVGAPVVTTGWGGAWAELRAVDLDSLEIVPAGVDLGEASALPVAGVTALRALREAGEVRGRHLLITGAAGGVGRFAVQLAHQAGARVVALVGDAARGAGLRDLGADEVLGLDAPHRPVSVVLDAGGGDTSTWAVSRLEAGGVFISIAGDGLPDALTGRTDLQVVRFGMDGHAGVDLAELVGLLASGRLDAQVGWRGDWSRISEAAEALLARRIQGKAVVTVS